MQGVHHIDNVGTALLRLEEYWRSSQPAAENQIAGNKMQRQIPEVGTLGSCAGATASSCLA
jgi:hypothetical protein